jgi:ribonuclease BN (tRNA processing enzyme)
VKLSVLGSGSAFSGCGGNACSVLDERVMVDVGAPPHVLLPRIGLRPHDLELVLLTHFHLDHLGMLPLLLGALAYHEEPPEPGRLTIAGPAGTRELVRRLVVAGFGSPTQRRIESVVAPRYAVLQDGDDTELCGYHVRSLAVVHSTGPSLAYSVTRGDVRVGFSGDTSLCPGIRRLAGETDVLVCECSGMDGPVEGGHLWRGEVEQLISDSPDCRFVLNHLSRRATVPGALLAHDLLTLELSAPARASGPGG